MRDWLVTIGEPLPIMAPPKPRLLRTGSLARVLQQRGHDVVWWTSSFDHYRKQHYVDRDAIRPWESGVIRILKSVGYRRNVSLARLVDHIAVARKFRKQAPSQPQPDVILVSLPTIELAREAVRFGRAHAVPVLIDVRDLWPDVLIDAFPPRLRHFSRLLLWWMIRDAIFALSNCTGIVGISDGYLDWALRRANRARSIDDAMVPLGYVAPESSATDTEVAGDRLVAMGVDPSKTLCWYVGSFGRQYDLMPVLTAASQLQRAGRSDIQFVISGEGELGDRWRRAAAGANNVLFTGWVGGDEITWLRAHAAIGLQPYADGAPQGLANKLFEYLSAGIPVVSSLRGENQRLIEGHACGLTYRPGDAWDCLAKITVLADDRGLRRAMGQRARKLFVEQFDSSAVLDGMAAHLEAVAMRSRR